ncbi:glycosyltransferase [Microbacterium stercoris]|uniref:D-inositol 3-phosphate glycosyltransferase n=1 Tax=Microbacterium stercoris TaxID=2820289 RepID=A0A939TYR4_9MICO|nr:glycosyltransferase [Microbacterium stercoris]MBO3664982.1 glycosyltransferase [Microbacterium stercoris]
MTRLLLFTNEYPYATGDCGFVAREIPYLAERFDDVVVFCHARDTSPGRVQMPANVTLGGNLFERSDDDRLWTPLTPPNLALLADAAWRELRAGRLLRHLRLFLMGARVGITQANRRAVREAIAGDRDTVAYAFWGMGGGLGLAWLRGVRAKALRLHRYDLYEDRAPGGYLPFRRFLLARADRILAISQDARMYLAETYRDRRVDAKTVLSRLGAEGPEEFTRPSRDGDERLVVSCSAVTDIKRVALILAALRALPGMSDEAPVRWVHFGTGPLMDDLQRAADEAMATTPGLRIDLRGQTPNEEIASFYRDHRVDVLVNASSSEGVPVSIMEAIAHDIPVVATAVGGSPEIVGSELRTGLLVSSDPQPTELARAIRTVLDSDDEAFAPRQRWRLEFDATVTGARAAQLVRDLIP